MLWTLVLGWIALVSLVVFVLAVADKRRAARGRARVPERTLLLLALVGGSPGLLAAMLLVRHKTRKLAFLAPLALILLLQLALAWWLYGPGGRLA